MEVILYYRFIYHGIVQGQYEQSSRTVHSSSRIGRYLLINFLTIVSKYLHAKFTHNSSESVVTSFTSRWTIYKTWRQWSQSQGSMIKLRNSLHVNLFYIANLNQARRTKYLKKAIQFQRSKTEFIVFINYVTNPTKGL